MRRGLLFGVAALLWSGVAHADLPVIDVGGHLINLQQLAQALKQVAADETMIAQGATQILHLKATVEAVMHGDVLALADLGPQLSGLGVGDLVSVGAGAREIMEAGAGVAFATSRLAAVTDRLVSQDAYYLPPSSRDWSAGRMVAQARSYASQKALAQSSFDSSAAQIKALRAARTKAASAGDVTSAAQAGAALTGVAAQAQMEANQLTALDMMQRAQANTLVAQDQQMSRCAWERLAANAKSAQSAADAGEIKFQTNERIACSGSGGSGSVVAGGDTPGTLTEGALTNVSLAANYDRFLGQSVGSGQCVALVQAADPSVGLTATWVQGAQVQGNTSLQPGTPIATFNDAGRYANATDGSSHAAIYLGQNETGIQVQDQWLGQPAHTRTIRFDSGGNAVKDGGKFYVVTHGV